jgi:hypothetical protein
MEENSTTSDLNPDILSIFLKLSSSGLGPKIPFNDPRDGGAQKRHLLNIEAQC